MKRIIPILAICALGATGLVTGLRVAVAADQPTTEVMRLKLAHAQGVLEGIAKEDYDRIALNAQKLVQLSQIRAGIPGRRPSMNSSPRSSAATHRPW